MTKQDIQLQIAALRMQIYALDMGHDYLSRQDWAQMDAWRAEIRQLESQLETA